MINRLRQAHLAVTSYAARAAATGTRARLVGALAELLKAAEPGSDRQVAVADAMISAIDSPAGAELLTGWLIDEEVPPAYPSIPTVAGRSSPRCTNWDALVG